MGKIFGLLGTVTVYFCIASVISLALLLVYGKAQGYLVPERVARMLAVARGEEPTETETAALASVKAAPLPPSYEQSEKQRQLRERHLDLREQALRNELQLIESERVKLLEKIRGFNAEKTFYTENLNKLLTTKEDEGRASIRQIWESVKPKQAKELMLAMLDKGENEEAAKIFAFMPIAKQAKIVAEFKTPEDQTKLDDFLRLLRLDHKSLPSYSPDGDKDGAAAAP